MKSASCRGRARYYQYVRFGGLTVMCKFDGGMTSPFLHNHSILKLRFLQALRTMSDSFPVPTQSTHNRQLAQQFHHVDGSIMTPFRVSRRCNHPANQSRRTSSMTGEADSRSRLHGGPSIEITRTSIAQGQEGSAFLVETY